MFDEQRNLIGRNIGGHEVIELLRTGTMGQVYLARQPGLGMTRAIKVMRGQDQDKTIALARFRREAMVLSRLHHHHIVQIIDFGELDDDDAYLVMEYIEGVDLNELVAASGPLDLGAALRALRDIADALRYAHSQGVLHRDLKPANIVARASDASQTKIIDFGLVRLLEDLKVTKLTKGDAILGSPQYMSPEQAQARGDLSDAIDVYALAGLTYFLVSGEPVFPCREFSTVVDVLRAHCVAAPIKLSERCRALGVETVIPEALDSFLLECLAKNPRNRPSSEEVAHQLEHFYASEVARRPAGAQATGAPIRHRARAPEEHLAQTIWQQPSDSPSGTARGRHLQAIQQKAEQALLALSAELTESLAGGSEIERQLAGVHRTIEQLESLELERALLASEEEIGETERLQAEELEDSLRGQFRDLFRAAMKDASGTSSADDLRDALRALIDSHRDLLESS